jgi:hypothetical protein
VEPRSPGLFAGRHRRALWAAALAAAFFHTLAVAWIWNAWAVGLRSGWLVWMDLPVSLLYLEAQGRALLAASLLVGGLWWALAGALLSAAVGFLVSRR